jgi:hypothetical protein
MAFVYRIKQYVSHTARPRWRVVLELPATREDFHICDVYARWLRELHPGQRYKIVQEEKR